MSLSVRPKVYRLPSYSLTGDLLGFLRCGLQYRYSRIGRLPPSRPVQLWFGEFIHGVMEEAYRRYKDSAGKGTPILPPWPDADIDDVCELIEKRLAARGLVAWDPDLKVLGRERAKVAIQELGPHLFPIIAEAEVRLSGARMLPPIPKAIQFREADRYEMAGIVDVLTQVQLADPALRSNPLIRAIKPHLPEGLPAEFEVIVDYKGMRRPPSKGGGKSSLWKQYEWQVLTYAELRGHQANAKRVAAGVLVYINELHPTRSDLAHLKEEVIKGTTDVPPQPGSPDDKALRKWNTKGPLISLSWDYRLRRALRVVPVDDAAVGAAVSSFDTVVKDIETCLGTETYGKSVLKSWTRNPGDQSSCVVCDCRTYCPDYQKLYAAAQGEKLPKLPSQKV